jgi:hypothetical protein
MTCLRPTGNFSSFAYAYDIHKPVVNSHDDGKNSKCGTSKYKVQGAIKIRVTHKLTQFPKYGANITLFVFFDFFYFPYT